MRDGHTRFQCTMGLHSTLVQAVAKHGPIQIEYIDSRQMNENDMLFFKMETDVSR